MIERRFTLANLSTLQRLADARGSLLRKFDSLKVTERPATVCGRRPLVITIDGEQVGEELLAIARPALERELRAQLCELDKDIEALGVSIG